MKKMTVRVWRGDRLLSACAQMTAHSVAAGQARGTGAWAGELILSGHISRNQLLAGDVAVEIPGVGRFPVHVWRVAGTAVAKFYGIGAAPPGLD